ncbi:MAG: ABC transporter permease [Defluviitaleaceae bacterium]|nr:ABC transporter permease [Defluviitaleaceae bacterium]
MDKIWLILKEQLEHLTVIFRIAKYERKASYQGHYLGRLWEILNPILQTLVFYVIFGIGLRSGAPVNGVPFLAFLTVGQASWLFMNSCVQGGSQSIKKKLNLVSKMKFPISILPTIFTVGKLNAFFIKMLIGILIALFSGILPTVHWFQVIYYFIAMILLVLLIGFLTSTISILITDFQFILSTVMRLIFFTSGIMFPVEDMRGRLGAVLRLNPFHYIVSGFRSALLYQENFWERGDQTIFFWAFTLLVGLVGAHLHLKFRARFSDFV